VVDEGELEVDLVVDDPEHATITVRGEVDLATKPAFVSALGEATDAGATTIALDLAGVGFLDSSGLGAVIDVVRRGVRVVVRRPQPVVRRAFEVVLIDGLAIE
jgi:anti-sigma B factor antagonist